MVEKSRSARIKLIVGIIGILIVFSVLLYYLPILNRTTSPSTSIPAKVVDASTIGQYFGGEWRENSSLSGYVKVNGTNGTIYFSNGTVEKIGLSKLNLVSTNVSRLLGIIEADLNQINFTTFTQSNQTVSLITLNYTSSYEPQQIFGEAYKGLSSLNLTNITVSAFELSYESFQIGIGYHGSNLYLIFYQGYKNEFVAISDLMKYLIS